MRYQTAPRPVFAHDSAPAMTASRRYRIALSLIRRSPFGPRAELLSTLAAGQMDLSPVSRSTRLLGGYPGLEVGGP
jgi:hypothetical protein